MADIVSDEMTLTLRKPIKLADRQITQLELREPTAYEVQQVEKVANKDGSTASNITLVALVSGLTAGEIGKVGYSDLSKALAFLSPFITPGPQTEIAS